MFKIYVYAFFFVDIPHDAFVNDKGKVQTHTFTDFPPTAEDEDEDVYHKTKVLSFWRLRGLVQCFNSHL